MSLHSTTLWTLAGALVLLAAACAPPPATGPDASSGSDASLVTWQDGKKAYAISCSLPQGCGQRAVDVCNHRPYTVLSSENMPSAGDVITRVQGKPSIVIRCG
jgi:hypothetical protein